MVDNLAAYRQAVDEKAWRMRQLAGRMQHTEDSGLILELSRELRTTAQELRELVHEHVVANRKRRLPSTGRGESVGVDSK